MATVQHPAFETATMGVADPAPWVEQGWILLDEQPSDNGGLQPASTEAPTSEPGAPAATDAASEPATAEAITPVPKPGPRDKK